MHGLEIAATGKALPSKVVTNQDISQMVDTSDAWIYERTGIRSRYQCQEENCASLAVQAARQALERAGAAPEEIGAVIVATTTPQYAFPNTACLVQKELGLSKKVMCFDLSAACTGFVYGLGVSRGLLAVSEKPYILLIGSEQLSRILDYTDRSSCVLFGDGAGAVLLKKSDQYFLHQAWADGDISDEDGRPQALLCYGPGQMPQHLKMNGPAVFKFAVRALTEGIQTILDESGMTMDSIDYVVCHQANGRIIESVRRKFHAPCEKFYVNIAEYANTSAASIPIALDTMMTQGMLQKGMRIICVGFGAGFTWSSALLTI